MTLEEQVSKSQAICRTLISTPEFITARVIMVYLDARGEVRTDGIIRYCWDNGKRVAVPVCVPKTHQLLASELMSFNELQNGFYNIREPKQEYIRLISPDQLDLIIVPAVAYDRRGYRIGYGGGYYDRFLSSISRTMPLVGIAFDLQIIEAVPVEDFDIPVNMVITESGIIRMRGIDR